MFHRKEGADEIDAEHFRPDFGRRIEKAAAHAAGDTGIGEHDVQGAEAVGCPGDERCDIAFLAGIADHRQRMSARGFDHGRGFFHRVGLVEQHEAGAFGSEEPCAGPADARTRAGDGGDPAFETAAHIVAPPSITTIWPVVHLAAGEAR